jgi:16S rRNA (guanine(966)-N(2))-methyltransferase RsmD
LRIISGKLGGRSLPGKLPPGIRPTLDVARESLFNILGNYIDFDNIKIADICAGSGAFGIEAISRGAAHCHFVDKSRKSLEYISSAISGLGLEKTEYELHLSDALSFLKKFASNLPGKKFDLIFTDPPYKDNYLNEMFGIISADGLIAEDGIFVCEHEVKKGILAPMGWKLLRSKTFGGTVIDIYSRE